MPKGITKTRKQSIDFFENFIRKDIVQNFVNNFRKEIGIPKNGILLEEEDLKAISEVSEYFVYYVPPRLKNILVKTYEEMQLIKINIITKCLSFTNSQKINSPFVKYMFLFYFIFNTRPPFIPYNYINDDLISVEHLPSEISFYKGLKHLKGTKRNKSVFSKTKHSILVSSYEHINRIAEKYPIAIYINPNISKRQLNDYIDHNWSYIQKYKDSKLKFEKNRQKRRQDRNDFIYENKDLPLKKISALISKKFPNEDADEGNIGKIISLEKKKRN